jgi:hypothetical protein
VHPKANQNAPVTLSYLLHSFGILQTNCAKDNAGKGIAEDKLQDTSEDEESASEKDTRGYWLCSLRTGYVKVKERYRVRALRRSI